MKFKQSELKEFLDEKVDLYNRPSFIEHDPISIPHLYSKRRYRDLRFPGSNNSVGKSKNDTQECKPYNGSP